MRFEMLKFDIAINIADSNPNSLMHSQIDVESVSATHGASCTNALGISPDHPVRLTLPKSSNAWFFMSGAVDADLRFRTTSAGTRIPRLKFSTGAGQTQNRSQATTIPLGWMLKWSSPTLGHKRCLYV